MINTAIPVATATASAADGVAPPREKSFTASAIKVCRNIASMATAITEAGVTGAATGACISALINVGNLQEDDYLSRIITGTTYGGLIAAGIRMIGEVADLFTYQYSSEYHPDNDGLFPLCIEGLPAEIKSICEHSLCNNHRFSDARQYLKTAGLAKRYQAKLAVKTYQEEDLPADSRLRKCERGLIGQDKVVATTPIRQGECLGIYGGDIASKAQFPDYEPLMKINQHLLKYAIDIGDDNLIIGRNILSRVNTIFEHDAATNRYKQAEDGYNCEIIYFPAIIELPETREIMIPVMFATRDIAPGQELRSNYNFSGEFIRQLLRR